MSRQLHEFALRQPGTPRLRQVWSGVKAFVRGRHGQSQQGLQGDSAGGGGGGGGGGCCQYYLTQEGLPLLLPYIKKQVLPLGTDAVRQLLDQPGIASSLHSSGSKY
jgi:hypothetical protein